MRADIGNNARHGAASQSFLGSPEHFSHGGHPHQHQGIRIKPEAEQPRPIGQAKLLPFIG